MSSCRGPRAWDLVARLDWLHRCRLSLQNTPYHRTESVLRVLDRGDFDSKHRAEGSQESRPTLQGSRGKPILGAAHVLGEEQAGGE